jgi:hypothetical protein
MKTLQHIEVQRFSQVRWLWFLMLALLIAELLFLAPQLIHEQPLLLILSLTAFLLPMILILFVLRFEFKIDEAGIHYRFIPRIIGWQTIVFANVAAYQVRDKESWYEKFHMGYHRNLFTKTTSVNIAGSKYLILTLKDGATIKLGTENPEAVEYALKKLLSETNE